MHICSFQPVKCVILIDYLIVSCRSVYEPVGCDLSVGMMVNNFLLLAVVILYILTIDSDKLKVNHSQTKSDISQILSFSK